MFGPQIGQGRITVKRLVMIETGTYNPQFRRPYETSMTAGVLNVLEERLAQANHFTPSMFAGVAGQFLKPQAAPESPNPIEIPYGWGERRMRFTMEVEYSTPVGPTITEVLTGYSEHYAGIATSGAIDPKLRFFVNSTVHLRYTSIPTPMGTQMATTVLDTSQVLVDNNWRGVDKPLQTERLRPTDVYSVIQRSHVQPVGNSMTDTRTLVTSVPVKSHRRNNVATSYAATLLDNYKNALYTQEFGQTADQILSEARGNASEAMVGQDPFMHAISQLTGLTPSNIFTWGDLLTLDPNADSPQIKHIMFMGDAQQVGTVHHAGDTAGWQGADGVTQAAAILGQAIPALLTELALTRVAFTATNRFFGVNVMTESPTKITITDLRGFGSMDLSQAGMAFEHRLEHEILKDLSWNNAVDYHLNMQVNLLGETRIWLSMDNGPEYEFAVPSFCDSLLAPVMTGNHQQAIALAHDFESIFDHMHNNIGTGAFGGNTTGVFGKL